MMPAFQATRLRSRVPWRALQMPRHDIQMRAGVTLAIRACASLALTRIAFHFDGDHCLIVEGIHASGVLGNGLEYLVHYAVR